MNFVFHHHLAARDLGSPTAGVGAMLPDLWRMADRRVRPAAPLPVVDARDEALAAVLAGIAHHVTIDRWFHKDAAFVEGERFTLERLRAAAIGAPRVGLFAHVLWEMCLDGALLRQIGLDPVLEGLRAGFAAVQGGPGCRAASLHHFDRVARTPEERALFDARMQRLFEEIARGPWVEGYRSGEGVAIRLQGVRARMGFSPMQPEDHARLAAAADELLTRAEEVARVILARAPGGEV